MLARIANLLKQWRLSNALDRGSVRRARRGRGRREPIAIVHDALLDPGAMPWVRPSKQFSRRVTRRISRRRYAPRSYVGVGHALAACLAVGACAMAWNAYRSYFAEPFPRMDTPLATMTGTMVAPDAPPPTGAKSYIEERAPQAPILTSIDPVQPE